jgi:hypothetical protein
MILHRAKAVPVLAALVVLLVGLGGCVLFVPTGTVSGTVYDSTAGGVGLAGVRVVVLHTVYSATTDSTGQFTVEAPVGSPALRFEKDGYSFTDTDVEVARGTDSATLVSIVGYHPLSSGQYRFVLTWAEYPRDLDSHLVLPGGTEEVYYGHKVAGDGSANLDWDDLVSYGPETVTIETVNPGTYTYYVHNYSAEYDMGPVSDAVVEVYNSTGLIKVQKISGARDSSTSTGRYWRVFTFNDGSFTWINEMADSGT